MTVVPTYLDIETHSAKLIYSMPPEEFVRLTGYRIGRHGKTVLTTDLQEVRDVCDAAEMLVTHNGNSFDIPAIYGVNSLRPLEIARSGKSFDTWTFATTAHPAPYTYINYKGHRVTDGAAPEKAKLWFKMEEQAHQLGVPGKHGDLNALAREFAPIIGYKQVKPTRKVPNPEPIPIRQKDAGYGVIPVTDPRFRDYLRQDVQATIDIADALLRLAPWDAYAKREQIVAAIMARMRNNGVRIHQSRAAQRRDQLDAERDAYMRLLVDEYNMPNKGAAPLRSNDGKAAIYRALVDIGVTPETDLPKTDTGNISYGGEGIIAATESLGEEAAKMGKAIAAIGGMRPLADAALRFTREDGLTHPEINSLQRSGRWSTQDPGYTTWTSRGPNKVEKDYVIPKEGNVFFEVDASQADARMVAACSGDPEFAKRFLPNVDAHRITALAIWGQAVVDQNDDTKADYRQKAKIGTHGWGFGGQAETLAGQTGATISEMQTFIDGMAALYKGVAKWWKKVRAEGNSGWVRNSWGRRMMVDRRRSFTQSPALYGQSGTRELICDCLIDTPNELLMYAVMQVHDAIVWDVPEDCAAAVQDFIVQLYTRDWGPFDGSGQVMHFPFDTGPLGRTWLEASH